MLTAAPTANTRTGFAAACDMLAAVRAGGTIGQVDRQALLAFDGWGPVAGLFGPSHQLRDSDQLFAERVADLAGEHVTDAADSVDTSFYTPKPLVEAVWRIVSAAGHTGGRVLDLGCGTGRFGAWRPDGWDYVGVEQDTTAAAAAQLLLPGDTIICDALQQVRLPGRFDVAVGNIPFSAVHIWADRTSRRVDNYFVERAVEALRPGGLAVLITPAGWLDHAGCNSLDATFVSAGRLPAGVFPGTQAVADIVLLQRGGNPPNIQRQLLPGGSPQFEAWVAEWWIDNPHMVAGQLRAGEHSRRPILVHTDDPGGDTARVVDLLIQAAGGLTVGGSGAATGGDGAADMLLPAGTFVRDGSTVSQAQPDGTCTPVKAGRELLALLDLRDAAKQLLAAEADTELADSAIAPAREHALALYRQYVDRFGPLNRGTLHEGKSDTDTGLPKLSWRRPRLGGFRADPHYPLVMALELFDQHTGTAEAAPILRRRINLPAETVDRCATAAEAVSITCGEGPFSLARAGQLLGIRNDSDTMAALGDLVFRDPAGGGVIPAGEYLSGDVRRKLDVARAAAARRGGGMFARNIAALDAAMPEQVAAGGFTCQLGSPLLSADDIADFVKEQLGAKHCSVERSEGVGTWQVEARSCDPTFTVGGRNAAWLVQQLANRRVPSISTYDWRKGKDVTDPGLTSAAQQQAQRISEMFTEWVWTDSTRADRITAAYNRRFRSHVARQFDGSALTFPGMDQQAADRLWVWQRNMVARMIATPAVLCGHAPGGGKTLTMVAGAATLRQFGLARKPMIVVPNHLLEQIAREAQQAYPLGRFLVAGTADLRGDGRATFVARCATGDWDAVIITHSVFTSIPVPPHVERTWISDQINMLRDSLRGDSSGFAAKEVARRVRSLEGRLGALRDTATTGTVTFDQLGVDYLAVDEAHLFKGLPIHTRTTGLAGSASKRATDLLLKATMLRWRKPGRPVLGLFTGTPWLNSLSETFVWQQFCQPERLADAGIDQFDTWAAMFVQHESRVEMRPDGGGMRIATRPTKLLNVPELRSMLAEVADIVPEDAMGHDRPDTEAHTHVVAMNDAQREKVAELVDRASRLSAATKHRDNMPVICGEGRRVALDPALLGLPGGAPKIAEAARTIAAIYRDTKDARYPGSDQPGALQIVFCDQGVPHPGNAQTYGRLRNRLVTLGVPAGRIRWVHEATDDRSRAALFAACRAGQVSVLLGSTDKLGLGTNVQTRAVAVHHVDAPWRPADVIQRDCRAVRPGNSHRQVQIHRYVTERSFDALMWETLERKAGFMAAFFRANSDVRTIDDISEVTLTFGEVKAAAAGNPAIFKHYETQQAVANLRIMRAVEMQAVTTARKAAAAAESRADRLDALAEALEQIPAGRWGPFTTTGPAIAGGLRRARRRPWAAGRVTLHTGAGLTVAVEQPASSKTVAVRCDIGYRTVMSQTCGSAREAAAVINTWWDTVARDPGRAAGQARAGAGDLRAEAARQTRFADTWRFSQAVELARAEADLAVLEASLAEAAA